MCQDFFYSIFLLSDIYINSSKQTKKKLIYRCDFVLIDCIYYRTNFVTTALSFVFSLVSIEEFDLELA
jgi:hypothetical protein